MIKTVQIMGYDGKLAYEVELADDGNHKVYVIKERKPLGFGYSYAPGANTYRSTIKAGGAIWKRQVKAAQAKSSKEDGPSGTADQRLAWYAERNLLRA